MRIKFNSYENATLRPITSLVRNFSPSFFISYKECPKAFYYKYIAKIQLPQKQIHLFFGDVFHQVIEAMLNNQDPKNIYEKKFVKTNLPSEEHQGFEKLFSIGLRMIEIFKKELPRFESELGIKAGKSEQWIESLLKDPFGDEILPLITKGKIDRFTDEERIIEYKTSSGKWDPQSVKTKWQKTFYSWMFYQNKGRHPKSVHYIIITKQQTPQIQVLETSCTLDDYAKLFAECKNIINKVELGIYDKPEEFHLPYCECHKFEEALTL